MKRAQRLLRGSLTVEAALFLPVLAVTLLGGLEYGWMLLKTRQLEAVAVQVAEVASAHHGTAPMAREAGERLLAGLGMDGLDWRLELTPAGLDPSTTRPGDEVGVVLSVPYQPLSLTGLARPAPALLPAPERLTVSATGARRGGR